MRGVVLSVREGRKNGAFSGIFGASLGLLRCWIKIMLGFHHRTVRRGSYFDEIEV